MLDILPAPAEEERETKQSGKTYSFPLLKFAILLSRERISSHPKTHGGSNTVPREEKASIPSRWFWA